MDRTIKEIFEQDRTCNNFSDKEISDNNLKRIYNLMKLGPTSANSCPLRIIFLKSKPAIDKFIPAVAEGNKEKVQNAPVTAIFAYDEQFYEDFERLFPPYPAIADLFRGKPEATLDSALRNSTLQAAYFMMLARGAGLGCGPMSGFDKAKTDKLFFSGTSYKSNFICTLGYPAAPNPHPRLPRYDFDEVCEIK